jgi:membrane protein DedA with SNARE-associated domain
MVAEYGLLALMAAVTAAGTPGPGDSALIAAALLANEGKLALAVVLVVAFLGALIGRAGGYAVGVKGGRPLLERPGRTEGFRRRTLAKGDHAFDWFPRFAPLIAPSPVAGIHRVPLPVFALASLKFCLAWTLGTGLNWYYLGPAAKDVLNDIGIKGAIVIVVIAAIGLAYRYLWQRRGPAAEAVVSSW